MAVGKTIIGAINGSGSDFINNNEIGYCCLSGYYESLAKIAKQLTLEDLRRIGKKSKNVYFKKYSKSIFINKMVSTLDGFSNK